MSDNDLKRIVKALSQMPYGAAAGIKWEGAPTLEQVADNLERLQETLIKAQLRTENRDKELLKYEQLRDGMREFLFGRGGR